MKKEERIKRRGKTAYAKMLQQGRDRYAANSEELKNATTVWATAHPEQAKTYKKAWYKAHPEQAKANVRKYSKTEKGKSANNKRHANRRALGFVELNEHFPNSEAHHIDKEFVIYIPAKMHQSIPHNVFTGKNMGEINALALDYVYGD